MKTEEIMIFSIFISLALLKPLQQLSERLVNFQSNVKSVIIALGWKLYLIIFIIILPFILYLNYQINTYFYKKEKEKEERKEFVKKNKKEVSELLQAEFEDETKELSRAIIALEDKAYEISDYFELDQQSSDLSNRIEWLRQRLKESRKEDGIREFNRREDEARKSAEYWEEKERDAINRERKRRDELFRKLEFNGDGVFKIETLTPLEIDILLENDYIKTTEYCVKQKKLITVLLKPFANHSPTHIFLVWSIKQLVKEIKGVKRIQSDLTADADITFNYGSKNIAIEVETGSLLKVKKQLERKVEILNDKYGNSWFFVVSNKNLIPNYRKFGQVTSRKGVAEKLQKMLKSPTP